MTELFWFRNRLIIGKLFISTCRVNDAEMVKTRAACWSNLMQLMLISCVPLLLLEISRTCQHYKRDCCYFMSARADRGIMLIVNCNTAGAERHFYENILALVKTFTRSWLIILVSRDFFFCRKYMKILGNWSVVHWFCAKLFTWL